MQQQELTDDSVYADILDLPKRLNIIPCNDCNHVLLLNFQQSKRIHIGVDLTTFTPYFLINGDLKERRYASVRISADDFFA